MMGFFCEYNARMRSFLMLPIMLLAFGLVGCARYEYDITRPTDLAKHIGSDADQTLLRDPLEYRLRTVDSRLVMRIYNPTDVPVTLLGQRSSVVDPGSQSHPLATQTISPQSFIKVILPPMRPRLERTGPSIGIGFGTMIGDARRHRYGSGFSDFDDDPQYLAVYDDDNALYWNWDGESSIRLTLVYQQGDKSFEHEFVIARRKM